MLRAPWSASKIQTALRCPREFHYKYVDKLPEPETMPDSRIGKAIHAAIEQALGGMPAAQAAVLARAGLEDGDGERFDTLSAAISPFLERLDQFRSKRRVNRQLVEFELAVREDLSPTHFHAGDALYRGICDAGFLYDDTQLAIIDHKTGFRVASHRIAEQLQGYAVLGAAQFRGVRRIWLGVHWVADAEVEWTAPIDQQEVRDRYLPALLNNIEAAALAVDDGPRPEPGGWCGRCGYRSVCPTAYEIRYEQVDDDLGDPFVQ
jgi:RecB family exonuclease